MRKGGAEVNGAHGAVATPCFPVPRTGRGARKAGGWGSKRRSVDGVHGAQSWLRRRAIPCGTRPQPPLSPQGPLIRGPRSNAARRPRTGDCAARS